MVLGEIAHIHGERPQSARYLPTLSSAARNAADNLLYVCPEHHTIIDTQVADYPAERLRHIKAEHEAAVERRLGVAVADVGFAELEVVCRRIIDGPAAGAAAPSFLVVELGAKMALNGLSERTGHLLRIGLASASVVADYLAKMESLDPGFPERLRRGFVSEYQTQVERGLRGDVLFAGLWDFACQGSSDFPRRAAGLVVLTHLFEACDLFERGGPGPVA